MTRQWRPSDTEAMARRAGFLRTALVVLVGLALVAMAACGEDEVTLQGVVRTPALEVADVRLPDADRDGELVALRPPAGELYLAYFGYTSCPDICPTTMSDIRVALGELPAELAQRVTVAMTTVDLERDTPEALAKYLGSFFDRKLALVPGDEAELAAAAEAFGVRWEIEAHEPGEAYDVSHTAVTYVIDDTGTVVVEWPFGFESEAMTSDLQLLLRKDVA